MWRPRINLSSVHGNLHFLLTPHHVHVYVVSMTKNVGFAIGIEFREVSLQLNAKNESRVRPCAPRPLALP